MLERTLGLLVVSACLTASAPALQTSQDASGLSALVSLCKEDARGPFQAIRWFCPDGKLVAPPGKCAQPGGIQRAIHRPEVVAAQERHGIYLGQILAGVRHEEFLDAANGYSRLKQYALERYLYQVDDGWVLRKARFYRGAYQSEDEEAWGKGFLVWFLAENKHVLNSYYLCREAVRVIPHRAEDRTLERIRATSKVIADSVPSFMEVRIKIHGQPDSSDIVRVEQFAAKSGARLKPGIRRRLEELAADLRVAFAADHASRLAGHAERRDLPEPIRVRTRGLTAPATWNSVETRCDSAAALLASTRIAALNATRAAARLALLDLSLDLETLLFRDFARWDATTPRALLAQCRVLAEALAGTGAVELHEWRSSAARAVETTTEEKVRLSELSAVLASYRRLVEWGTGMVRATYGETQALFASFEPPAWGFIDDRVHSTVLLRLGDALESLSALEARAGESRSSVLDSRLAGQARGLNPGYARGLLTVAVNMNSPPEFRSDGIYVLTTPPADLKPVAGIATVTEGNVVSHVQLLARNLGIPNAVFSRQLVSAIAGHSGTEIFYAVSPKGVVVMKSATDMSATEQALFAKAMRPVSKVSLPANRIDLSRKAPLPLIELRAKYSGTICGPKAANLGQLRADFPEMVAPGVVIPFGVFYEHMQQGMPGTEGTYWKYLAETFADVPEGETEEETEARVLPRLARLRESLKTIAFLPQFADTLRKTFVRVFGSPLGRVAVFIRSDTNVEDLKDFTGAGLNLTVPNVVDDKEVLQAIRDVWASPYSERSYRWRQKFLLNPRHVYPSILLLRSVNCDKSGVMITTGLSSGNPRATTVSFNRGVAGAVDGQAAEVWEIGADGVPRIQTWAREPRYVALPPAGGTVRPWATFEEPLLSAADLGKLAQVAKDLRARLPGTPGVESSGPFDVELGLLNGNLWLFQVRPFVENRGARASAYLASLDTRMRTDPWVHLDGAGTGSGRPSSEDSR